VSAIEDVDGGTIRWPTGQAKRSTALSWRYRLEGERLSLNVGQIECRRLWLAEKFNYTCFKEMMKRNYPHSESSRYHPNTTIFSDLFYAWNP